MAVDLSTLTDYSWSNIAKAAKAAMVNSALGGSMMSINGQSIGRLSISELKKLYELAQEMIAAEDSTAETGIALVQYGERV